MERFCQRCRQWRSVHWKTPGSSTYCEGCLQDLTEKRPTAAQVARKERSAQQRQKRVDALVAWIDIYKAQQGCAFCKETDPSCLDCHPAELSAASSPILDMIRRLKPVEDMKAELEKSLVICSNCYRKQEDSKEQRQPASLPLPTDPKTLLYLRERQRRTHLAALVRLDAEIVELQAAVKKKLPPIVEP